MVWMGIAIAIVWTLGILAWAGQSLNLITLIVPPLVLTIGLLGLGRLQAQLWRSSGELHATGNAWMLGRAQLEQTHASLTANPGQIPTIPAEISLSGTTFTTELSISSQKQVVSSRIQLQWQAPSGRRFLQLNTAVKQDISASDARWLFAEN